MATSTVRADARERAARAFAIGLGLDLAVAGATSVALWVTDADITQREAWTGLGVLVAKSMLQAAASYIVRLKVSPRSASNR